METIKAKYWIGAIELEWYPAGNKIVNDQGDLVTPWSITITKDGVSTKEFYICDSPTVALCKILIERYFPKRIVIITKKKRK